jgi:hypothetical protein
MTWKRNGMTGSTNLQRKKISMRTRKIEYRSNPLRIWEYLAGSIEKKIFEPSSGGIGMRLKIAKVIFIATIYAEIPRKAGEKSGAAPRITRPNTRAIKIFDAGPAREMRNSPRRRFFTL